MGIDHYLDIDYRSVSIEAGYVFIMTTDDMHDYLSDAQLKKLLEHAAPLQQLSDSIIASALDAGSHDNETCQLPHIENLPSQQPNEIYYELTRLPFPPHLGPGLTMEGYEILVEIHSPVERLEQLGTKNHTAPEYLLGIECSNRSDLFSLGVICYEMLTGHLPYGDQPTRQLNWRTLNKIKYTSVIIYNPMIPLWLDVAVAKAYRLEHRSRYGTFFEYLSDPEHPKSAFMNRSAPLLDKHPDMLWKVLAAASTTPNLIFICLLLH